MSLRRFSLTLTVDAVSHELALQTLRLRVKSTFPDEAVIEEGFLHPDGKVRKCDLPPEGCELKSFMLGQIRVGQFQDVVVMTEVYVALPAGQTWPEDLQTICGGSTNSPPWVLIWSVVKNFLDRLKGSYIWANAQWKPLIQFLQQEYYV